MPALAPLLAAGGLVGYVLWCWWTYGEPLLYRNAHDALFAKPPLVDLDLFKLGFLPSVADRIGARPGAMVNLVVAALLSVLVLASTPAVARRFSPAYAVYTTVVVGIVWLGSVDLIGAGRYLLCAFPAHALWGEWLAERRALRRGLGALGLTGSLVLTVAYTWTVDLGW